MIDKNSDHTYHTRHISENQDIFTYGESTTNGIKLTSVIIITVSKKENRQTDRYIDVC